VLCRRTESEDSRVPIHKAVIPAAGKGTRVAALSRGHPKECLEVAGYPMIALALLELACAGVREVALVVSPEKVELTQLLSNLPPYPEETFIKRLHPAMSDSRNLGAWPRIVLFEQDRPLGVVDAIARARAFIANEPFALVMPDNFLVGGRPPLTTLGSAFDRFGEPVLGLIEVSRSDAARQGNCGLVHLEPIDAGIHRIRALQPKGSGRLELAPERDSAPRAVGRSIVPPEFAEPDWLPGDGEPGAELDDVPRFRHMVFRRRLLGVELGVRLHDLGQESGIQAAREWINSKG